MYSQNKLMDIFDDVVVNLGTFGKYNLKKMSLLWFPLAMHGLCMYIFVFTAGVTEYRCKVRECENENNSNWTQYAIPEANSGKLDKCSRFSTYDHKSHDVEVCSREWFNNKSIVPCDEYVYGEENTISREFNLGCQEWKRTSVGMIRGVALLISQVICGVLSDRYGRKTVLILSSTLSGLTGILKSFSPTYELFIVMEFIDGVIGGGVVTSALTLMMEMISPKGRIVTQNILYTAMFIISPLLALVSWAFQDWRMTILILESPKLLIIIYIWLIDESVRWLLIKGKNEKVVEILRRAVRFNFKKGDVPESLLNLYQGVDNGMSANELHPLNLKDPPIEQDISIKPPKVKQEVQDYGEVSIKQVLQSAKLRLRVLMIILAWLGTAILINGLKIYGLQYLPGSKYWNFAFMNIADPIVLFMTAFTTLRFGRKKVMACMYIFCSLCCFVVTVVPKSWKIVSIVLFSLGKYGIKSCYTSLYGVTGEIFPTSLRSTFMGLGNAAAMLGFTVASQVPLLASYLDSLPVILFGLISLCLTLTLIPLPETANSTTGASSLGRKMPLMTDVEPSCKTSGSAQ